ncbi:MAG: hydroxyisourate hydrolase [Lysobacterales bacterium]
MGHLTTHVLDISNGCPAAAIRIELFRSGHATPITTVTTNSDGRCDAPLLADEGFVAGSYELVFHAGEYFTAKGHEDGQYRFLDQVVIRFGVDDTEQHYHVPLLLSPFGYSTYRGS